MLISNCNCMKNVQTTAEDARFFKLLRLFSAIHKVFRLRVMLNIPSMLFIIGNMEIEVHI